MRQAVLQLMRRQEGVISRSQTLAAGMTSRQIELAVGAGAWLRVHNGVYRLAGAPVTAYGQVVAASLARPGALVSHQSAAWLWGLVADPPPLPTLSVLPSASHHTPGIVVHRVADLPAARIVTWRGIPATNPLRTLVDLAGMTTGRQLDDAVDQALAARLVTVEGLLAEAGRGADAEAGA